MKLFKKLAIMAMVAFAFTACEDVPAPYNLPGEGGENGDATLSENLLENSDFETWENNKPVSWGLTVSNADIEESTDGISGGKSVLIKGYAESNKRFASKSYFLLPGTYYLSAYVKKSGNEAGKFRMGYAILTNGVAVDYTTDYQYLTSATEVANEWEEFTANFTLTKTTEIAIMLVNSKSDAPILVDDVTLKTIGGGLSEDTGGTPSAPSEMTTIANVISAGAGSAKTEGTIIATYARGFIINDGTASILVYLGSEHSYVAGDVVTVEGTTSQYAGMLQFGAGTTVEKTGTATVTHPTVSVMSAADMDAYLRAPVIKYVQYTGKLTISGYYYNVEISGASTAIGSISYPINGLVDESLNGKEITVTGYTIGVSQSKFINTMAVSVVVADGSTTPDEGDDESETGESVVFDFTNPTGLTPSITPAEAGKGVEFDEVTFTNSDVTITAVKNTATTKVRIWTKNDGTTEFRSYKNSTITISCRKGISKIAFDGKKVDTMTADKGSFSDGVWTGSETDEVTFSVTGTLNVNTITVE